MSGNREQRDDHQDVLIEGGIERDLSMRTKRKQRDELRDVLIDNGIDVDDLAPYELDFKDLMRMRVSNILLVSSRYDFYTLVDDGQLTEAIFSEYQDLNLHYAPSITRVHSGEAALQELKEQNFDLVITMMRLGDMKIDSFCESVKKRYPNITVALLANQGRALDVLYSEGNVRAFDQIFTWSGDRRIFLALIKLLEDWMNAPVDCLEWGVRAIILVEDSPQFYSAFLPMIYTELIKQSQRLIEEGKNFGDKLLRQRARPKILHARTWDEAWRYFRRYRQVLLGIITDLKFPIGGVLDERAGLTYIKRIREHEPELPILAQSSKEEFRYQVTELGAAFVNKNSRTLLQELRQFMLENFGFGDFIFRLPGGQEIARAKNLEEFRDRIATVPDKCLVYHASRDHFSNWLMARTKFRLAQEFKPLKVSDFESVEALRTFTLQRLDELATSDERGIIADFSRDDYKAHATFLRVGGGSLGGKARGLAFFDTILKNYIKPSYFPGVNIAIPRSIILCTDVFAEFMANNQLFAVVVENLPDEELLERFLEARFPVSVEQDLRTIVARNPVPLAIRSSSLLEDTLYQPFAGIYATIMIPNSHPDPEVRFRELKQAIKYVYASTYMQGARNYIEATGHRLEEEQMAVIIQHVAGRAYGRHYYPNFSGVARSFNYYPFGDARQSDGIVNLALGLGKTIVDGGVCAQFCPAYPSVMPQFMSRKDYYANSQREFYALDLESDFLSQKVNEEVNLAHLPIKEAERHGTLTHVASTYCAEDDALYEGTFRDGLRVVNFAPILQSELIPLARILRLLMQLCRTAMNCDVEIEFAGTLGERPGDVAGFHFLQVRPMVKEEGTVDLHLEQAEREDILLRSNQVLGNGVYQVHDVVYIKSDAFDGARTREMAREVGRINAALLDAQRPYLLIGPGRWGSADPFLGIPVRFTAISGARAIVESSLPNMLPDPSQGSHFFQNLTSFQIAYFTARHYRDDERIDWDWLNAQEMVAETEFVRHVRVKEPIEIRVDGQTGSGVVFKRPRRVRKRESFLAQD